jgi:cationic peptide transport system permease protein
LGDWGNSLNSGQALKAEILQVIPASLELVSYALILSFTLGISLGFLAALVRDTPWDRFAVSLSLAGYSIPIFWFCILAISVFSMQLNWLPLSGRIGLLNSVPSATGFIFIDIFLAEIPNKFVVYQDAFLHLILPTFCLTVATFTVILRIVRRSTLEVLKIDYIKAATCKGLTRKQVFWRHTARNALIPALPNLASQIGILLTNALIVESIFSWPGIGNWLLQAIYQQDYSAIQIGLFVVSSLAAIVIILMETLSHLLDPKNRTTVSVKA